MISIDRQGPTGAEILLRRVFGRTFELEESGVKKSGRQRVGDNRNISE